MFLRSAVAVAVLATLAHPCHAEDLLEIYRQSLANDARWAAAQHEQMAGAEKLTQGRAGLLPTLSLSGAKTWYDSEITYHGSTPFVGGVREYDSREYGANLSQPLYRKQNIAQYLQGRAQSELAEAQLAAARTGLMLRVTESYFNVLLAQDTRALAEAQLAAFGAEYEQAQARFAAGAVAITEVYETQARRDLATSQELAARNDLEGKRQELLRLTGSEPGPLARLTRELAAEPPTPNDVGHWVDLAVATSPQLKAQQKALEVAEREVEKARGAHLPTIDAVAGYTSNHSSGSMYTDVPSEMQIKNAGIQVQLPLFEGGAMFSREREAVALREKARDELTDAKRLLTQETRKTFLSVVHAVSQIQALQQAVTSSENSLDAIRESTKVGIKTRTDVLNAEQQLFSARRDLARARHAYLFYSLQLKGVVGTLADDDIAQVNNLLTYD
jgi:outer membrane protein